MTYHDEVGSTILRFDEKTDIPSPVYGVRPFEVIPASVIRITLNGVGRLRLCHVETIGGKIACEAFSPCISLHFYVSSICQLKFPRYRSVN